MNKETIGIAILATLASFTLSEEPNAYALNPPPQRNGFVCSVGWINPQHNSAGGQFGFVTGDVFTQPFCQGTHVGLFAIYSVGQTLDPSQYSYTEIQLWNTFKALQDSMLQGKRVNISGFPTSSAFPGYSDVTFSGN